MNYRPMGNRIVIKVLTRSEVEVGGIKLAVARGVNQFGKGPKEWESDVLRAEIVRVGPDVQSVEEGQVVIIPGASGRWMDFDIHGTTDTHRICDEDEVLAIEEPETDESKEAIHVVA